VNTIIKLLTSHSLNFYYLYLAIIMLFILSIVLNFLPVIIIYGANLLLVFIVSLFIWRLSLFAGLRGLRSFTTLYVAVVVILICIDYFIIVLRPLTLTLRIMINIRLGHFLVEYIIPTRFFVLVVCIVETFVYMIQTYVFFILVKSYVIK
jgi:hypothetical protein